MEKKDVLVIGGGPSGWMSAYIAKKEYNVNVGLIRQEEKVLIPCAIPYIFRRLGSVEKNYFPDEPLQKAGVDITVSKAVSIDKDNKVVSTMSGDFGYDKLILALGSSPIIPPIEGTELKNIYSINKDPGYIANLSEKLKSANDVVIVGCGFIGVEFADELKKNNSNATIIEMLPHCLQAAHGEEYCSLAQEELKKVGVNLKINKIAKRFVGKNKVEKVILGDGEEIECDLVLLAIGANPNTKLAKEAGLETTGYGICVDDYMQTSNKDVFAVGDCAEKVSFFTKKPSNLRLASIATNEARIAAANLYEIRRKNKGAIGVYSTCIGEPGISFGAAGLSETEAEKAGLSYISGEMETVDKHPGSMPGSRKMKIKLLFEKATGILIGGQVTGGPTTGEIVNNISALINGKETFEDIIMFQAGTHPLNTPSPVVYPLNRAAEDAKYKNKI